MPRRVTSEKITVGLSSRHSRYGKGRILAVTRSAAASMVQPAGTSATSRSRSVRNSGVDQLGPQVPIEHGRGEPGGTVGREGVDDVARVEVHLGQREPEVEQVTALLALVERADLGGEQFGGLEGRDIGGAGEPARFHRVPGPSWWAGRGSARTCSPRS